eukprot:jgi/Undpi1/8262/HiC_scaffold_25.g10732.m1
MHDATADEAKANNAMEAGGGAPSSTMEDIPVGNTADTLVNTASSPDYTIQKSASVGPSIASKIGIGGNHTLSAVDLSYTIQIAGKDSKDKVSKTLIHPLTFSIKPTEMVAIMGASGAGKSTLLDVLAQRIPFSQVDGSYLLDGSAIHAKEFKRMSGYVMQDDALYPLLTVRETLQFAAELRIPNLHKGEKHKVVEETIKQLKLTNCADTKVGNEIHRGISGGEKRRVSIGVDTVQQPSIIFLDEPTSGLDSTTALTIAETLSSVCKRSRTVAMTIHQPSTRVLDVFDKVMFLSRGRMVFYGKPADLPSYCTGLGKQPPAFSNIGEYFLEVVDEYEAANNVKALSDHYAQALRMRAPSAAHENSTSSDVASHDFANPAVKEIGILLRRQWLNVLRTPELAVIRVAMCSVVALVLGSLFWQSDVDEEGLGKRSAYFAFGLALFLFTSLEALPIFLEERSIYTREHSRGAYRVLSYSLCNFIIYLPVCLTMSVVFTAISYFMIDLPPTGFVFQILATFMVLLEGNAFATAVSAIAPDPLTGNSAGTALLAFMFLFSGFFISYSSIPKGWRWFTALSMFKYPFEGMIRNMLDEEEDRSGSSQALENFAESSSVEDVDIWSVVYGPLCFIVGFRLIFYIALVTKHSGSRK